MNIEQMQKMPITNIKQQQQQRRIYLSMYLIKMVQLFSVAIIIRLWLISSACKEFSAGNAVETVKIGNLFSMLTMLCGEKICLFDLH